MGMYLRCNLLKYDDLHYANCNLSMTIGAQAEKRKKILNEQKRMQLDEEKNESKGLIDENKILFWREHMKMESERRHILVEEIYPPSPPSLSFPVNT